MNRKIIGIISVYCLFWFSSLFAQKHADIMFMHDVHSFLQPSPKIKVLIDEQKQKNPSTLVFDAGDFSMGTMYQTVFSTQAAELRVLGEMGVDATTIGNHEFDYGVDALAQMFDTARKSGDKVPELVLCNVDWTKDNDYTRKFKAAMERYNQKDYIMIQKDDLNVAVIGVFGTDAYFCSPSCELTFTNQYESVRKTVAKIKSNEKADLIVCLSHSGTYSEASKSEDEILAKRVPELDVIISGHTHTKLDKPIIVGETIIGSCEAYSAYLGNISLTQKENGRWKLDDYHLTSISDSIREDGTMKDKLAFFDKYIDEEYFSKFGYTGNQVVSKAAKDFNIDTETGYLMADGIYESVKRIGVPVDVAIVPSGNIRGTYEKGDVTVAEVFESYSLGYGEGRAGYPLVSAWISGKELKNMAEIDCSISGMLSYARLFTSGFKYEYNPKRMILNKVTKVYVKDADDEYVPVQKDRLYCVVTDMQTARMLGNVMKITKGLISIVPKDRDSVPYADLDEIIVRHVDGSELKSWIAIAKYLEEYSLIPNYVSAMEKAVVSKPSINPVNLFFWPSTIGLIVYIVVLVLISALVLICFLIIKRAGKKKNQS